jgi:hypothetical protein
MDETTLRRRDELTLRRRGFLRTLGLGMAGLSLPTLTTLACEEGEVGGRWAGAGREPPNFVFFLIDDLGWKDLGSFGSTFHLTPNIDGLAASGMCQGWRTVKRVNT